MRCFLLPSTSAIALQASTPKLFPPKCTSSTSSNSRSSDRYGSSSDGVLALRFLPRIEKIFELAGGADVEDEADILNVFSVVLPREQMLYGAELDKERETYSGTRWPAGNSSSAVANSGWRVATR